MANLVYFILAVAVIYISFKKSIILGLIALFAGFGIITYILYPKIVIGKANEKFNNGDFDGAEKITVKSSDRAEPILTFVFHLHHFSCVQASRSRLLKK